jgi:hypothetical protein
MPRYINREEFNQAVEAVWSEIQYQDNLPRRTDDEAKDVPAFATLGRRYLRLLEDHWADQPGTGNPPVVEDALNDMRKIGTVFIRGMIYCGIRRRIVKAAS